jgi:hypothetical protein
MVAIVRLDRPVDDSDGRNEMICTCLETKMATRRSEARGVTSPGDGLGDFWFLDRWKELGRNATTSLARIVATRERQA